MKMKYQQNIWLVLSFLVLLVMSNGCAQKTTIVLMSDPEGKVGQILVRNDAGTVEIDQPAEATVVKGRQNLPSPPEIMSEEKIAADFSEVLAVLPEQPRHFILYFKRDSTELTEVSQQLMTEIVQDIRDKNSQDISVVGHSDTAGDARYNLQLSSDRASAVAAVLKEEGVASADITMTSHGEVNQLIKTGNNVDEPRNRRVEVVVR